MRDFVTPIPLTKSNHKDPTNWQYIADLYENRSDQTLHATYANGSGFHSSGCIYDVASGIDFNFPSSSDVYNIALERLNEKVRGGMDLSTDVTQTRQNITMFRNAGRVERYIGGIPLVRRVSSAFLELQFGWKPLLQDVFDIADERIRYILNKIQRYRAGARIRVTPSETTVLLNVNPPGSTESNYTTRPESFISCRLSVEMEIPDFDLARWTSLNPVSMAWELLPYSFVVDWFFNVGSYLRQLETGLLYNQYFRGGYVSYLWVGNATSQVVKDYTYPWGEHQHGTGTGYRRYRSFQRTVLTHYPLPYLPSVRTDLGATRMFEAAGLLGNLLGRKEGPWLNNLGTRAGKFGVHL
jgi:hypothetical protein